MGLVNRAGEASLGVSERAAAEIRNAPWYAKPALAAKWAAGGAGYIASEAGDLVVSGAGAIKDTHDSGVWSTGASTASTPSRDVREVDSALGVSRDPAQR